MKKVYILISTIFIIIFIQLFYLQYIKKDEYKTLYEDKMNNYVYSNNAPRGEIYDRNGILLVGNKEKYVIYYKKNKDITMKDEISIATTIAILIDIKYKEEDLKEFIYLTTDKLSYLNKEEKSLYENRKLNNKDIKKIVYSKINLEDYKEIDYKVAKLYLLMNSGYIYEKKLIIDDISNNLFFKLSELNLKGIICDTIFIRYYPYESTLKTIFGTVGKIYKEEKSLYKKMGYNLNDQVGISYLENEYETYLRGEKAIYKVNNNGNYELIKESVKGKDLYLSIDINIQLELEKIIKEEIIKAKKYENTDYFNSFYGVIGDPLTGKILGISAQKLVGNSFIDITHEILSSSFTVGSSVKGASIAVGYNNNLIDTNKYIKDSCVKLYLVPKKCSWKSLGNINDIDALRMSSNYYQYLIAISLTGKEYKSNIKINDVNDEFKIYRDTFNEYGLGVKTNIDLPNESIGIIGSGNAPDLLLNMSIGQFDTYTLLQLLQYINTIANDKKRIELSLLDKIYDNKELIYEKNNLILNTLSIKDDYQKRVIEGLKKVISSGTGYNYFNKDLNGVGKTGTSESFIDTNLDNKIDLKTYSGSFVGYFPFDKPKYSIALVAPNISYDTNEEDSYIYYICKYISRRISDFLFENY